MSVHMDELIELMRRLVNATETLAGIPVPCPCGANPVVTKIDPQWGAADWVCQCSQHLSATARDKATTVLQWRHKIEALERDWNQRAYDSLVPMRCPHCDHVETAQEGSGRVVRCQGRHEAITYAPFNKDSVRSAYRSWNRWALKEQWLIRNDNTKEPNQ